MINENNKKILFMSVPQFISECGIDYNKHINDIWPSVEFLTIEKRENEHLYSNFEIHMLDYLGTGQMLEYYKAWCDNSRLAKAMVELNSTFYNMSGSQLEASFNFIEKLLNKYDLSIYQKFSVSQKYAIQNELIQKGKSR